MSDFKDILKIETQELIEKVNELHDFMKSEKFYDLSRVEKDLLYAQQEHMMKYLQVLGKRCEFYEIKLEI